MRKRTLAALAALTASILLSSCYEVPQALRYLSIISKAENLDRALVDPKSSPELRLLLDRARDARAYALSHFGLKPTRNYTKVVQIDADRLATVVQADGGLSFTRYLWSYPFVGKLPYRGYFDPKQADEEAARLRKQGMDVIARPVDAFSTLGFLADPLFSFMSSYSEADIADLVMHEMTHATIFLRGNRPGIDTSQFNEQLATFVGGEGSLLYLEAKYGSGSPEVAKTRAERADSDAFSAFLAGTGKRLEAVYASTASDAEKLRRKTEIIADRAEEYKKDYSSLFKSDSYKDFRMDRINNAYIDLYRLYEGEPQLYRDFYEKVCGSDMRRFIQAVGIIAKASGDPAAEMRREAAAAGTGGVGALGAGGAAGGSAP